MKKKSHAGLKAFVIVLVICTAGVILYKGPLNSVKEKAVGSVLKSQLVSQAAGTAGLSEEQAEDLLNVIPRDQQEEVIRIVSDHVTPSSIAKVTEAVKNKDTAGLIQYVQSELSPEEKNQVEQIAYQNSGAVASKLSEYGVSADKAAAVLSEIGG